jgi:hypothetical protein
MYMDLKHYSVRQEQNQALLQEAAFERWLSKTMPRDTERGPLLTRIVHLLAHWVAGWQESIQCSEAVPACGLQMAA